MTGNIASIDIEIWNYAGTPKDKSLGSAIAEGPGGEKWRARQGNGGYITGQRLGLYWKPQEAVGSLGTTGSEPALGRGTGRGEQVRPSPERLLAIVPMCTYEDRKKMERPGNVQETLRKNTQTGEITESPELRSPNENKDLSVPALSPSKYQEYFNCLPNIYPACLC